MLGIKTQIIEDVYYREKETRIDTLHPSNECMRKVSEDYPEDEYKIEFIAGTLDNGITDRIQKIIE